MAETLQQLSKRVDQLEETMGRKFDHLVTITETISKELAAVHSDVKANAEIDEKQNKTLSELSLKDKSKLAAIFGTIQVIAEIVRAVMVQQ